MLATTATKHCHCGNDKPFAQCCEPFLTFKEKSKTVRQLVRARYCAYALGAGHHREFLVRTWHPGTVRGLSIADLTNDNLHWLGLEIIRADQRDDRGSAEFRAYFRQEEDGPLRVHHERALFHRIKGLWLYVEGQVQELTQVVDTEGGKA
ncbi:MAG: hypothetical protein LBF16_14070 [Pseudomonadales bacterium]|jgi:SEC-C motif-containing protein|nr:hypothetical protein [Pseudomonadales bacterium]